MSRPLLLQIPAKKMSAARIQTIVCPAVHEGTSVWALFVLA
jgi:hypothetical protein